MKQSNGNGEEGADGDAFSEAIKRATLQTFAERLGALAGTAIGFLFTVFLLPLIIVYAYNGMQPEVWADISYLPTVAGLFVFRALVHMLRTE